MSEAAPTFDIQHSEAAHAVARTGYLAYKRASTGSIFGDRPVDWESVWDGNLVPVRIPGEDTIGVEYTSGYRKGRRFQPETEPWLRMADDMIQLVATEQVQPGVAQDMDFLGFVVFESWTRHFSATRGYDLWSDVGKPGVLTLLQIVGDKKQARHAAAHHSKQATMEYWRNHMEDGDKEPWRAAAESVLESLRD